MEKYARSAVGQLCQHYERKKLPDGGYVKFGNEDIDTTQSHLNYNLAPERKQIDFINQRCSEVKCMNRKDVNVMVSWVVTLPKDFPQERSREFFEQAYRFLNERYGGEQNVISAYVHLDETSPHMHYAFVPVVKDKKSGKDKVSAKECISKGDLLTFHKNLEKHLYRHFGFEVGVLNGATKSGNLSIKELKLQSSVEALTKKETELKATVQSYEDLTVSVKEVEAIGKKQFIGKNIVVAPEEYALLQEQAKAYRANQAEILNIRESWREIEEERKRLKAELAKVAETRKQAEQLWNMATLPSKFQAWYHEMEQRITELTQQLKDSVPQKEHQQALLFREGYIHDLQTELEEKDRIHLAERKELTEVKSALSSKYREIQRLEQTIDALTPKVYTGRKMS
jgi:hypothetical protein